MKARGDPIVLVHGFASSKDVNWAYPGWTSALTKDGRRVIALDLRGHGESTKLYDSEDYHIGTMAGDVRALMDHLNIERADMMGYSMGGRITAYLGQRNPERLRNIILGGIGMGLIEGGGRARTSPLHWKRHRSTTSPIRSAGRFVRLQIRPARIAGRLAACLRGSRRLMTREEAAAIAVPTLIAVGTTDDIAGSASRLGEVIPGSQVLDIPNRDHMRAVGDRVYKDGVLEFLAKRP